MAGDRNDLSRSQPHVNLRITFLFRWFFLVFLFLILIYLILELKNDWVTNHILSIEPRTNIIYILEYSRVDLAKSQVALHGFWVIN